MPTMNIHRKTICPLDCPDTCAMIATVAGGRITALSGDPDHPYTNGVICRKMRRYPERLYNPDRVLFPQIRVGPKGAGDFRRISWDQAWDCLVERLGEVIDRHGGESVLPFCYAGNMGMVNRFAGFPLFHRMGAVNLGQTICAATAGGGWKMICGNVGGTPPERAAEADLIVVWGINVKVSNLHFWPYIAQARQRGAQLLVIDPYRNDTARSADEHVWVTPGGDAALALGILKLLVEADRLDHRFIEDRSRGFAELAAYLRRTPVDAFERQSGIGRETMAALAGRFGSTRRTFVRIGVGLTRNSRGGAAVRAIGSLAACCGWFSGEPGQGVLLFTKAFNGDNRTLTMPQLQERPTRTVNMIHAGEALNSLSPPVKALIVYNANPLSVAPDSSMVRNGLAREDLFTVVHEQVMTPTARYADLLLPATTFLENRDIYGAYGHFYMGIADRVVDPLGEALSNFDFFQTLARRMGYTDPPFSQTLDERLMSYLETVVEVTDRPEPHRYGTSGPMRSATADIEGCRFDGINTRFTFTCDDDPSIPRFPCLQDAVEFDHPDLKARYPYRLITPPNDRLLNSTFGERYVEDGGTFLIHPQDASREGIGDGARAWLYNSRGRLTRRATVTADTQPGLIVAEGIYWPAADRHGGVNDLTSQHCSDIGGGAIFHESLVAVRPDSEDGS
jgi:anaerobic selenocysteine-containing dehydrogenase